MIQPTLVLSLTLLVFGSLDMSRASSMTTSGQCRLAPLILAILDSCQLYDYLVKSLFHLHSSEYYDPRMIIICFENGVFL